MREIVLQPGDMFGSLRVINPRYGTSNSKKILVLCFCKRCGTEKPIIKPSLLKGQVSCGCYQREVASRSPNLIKPTHGMSRTRTYAIWAGMIERCSKPDSTGYKRYGGRGIKVVEKWLKFESFLNDMGECPEGLSIDRVNNDGDYCPENCRWATAFEQANNCSTNKLLTFRDQTQTVTQWATELSIPRTIIYDRLRRNWTIEETLTEPIHESMSRRVLPA